MSENQKSSKIVSKKFEIDSTKLVTSLVIAGIINSAFETGINPAWFEVKSMNKGGFLDSAFASPAPIGGELSEGMETPSGKPARADWSIEARLNGYGVEEEEEGDSEWVTLTAEMAVKNVTAFFNNEENSPHPRKVMFAYLNYLEAMNRGDYELAEKIWDDNQFDGESDDGFAQIAICGDWILG